MADFDFEDDPALGVSETSNGGADGQASSSYLPAGEEDIQDYVSITCKAPRGARSTASWRARGRSVTEPGRTFGDF